MPCFGRCFCCFAFSILIRLLLSTCRCTVQPKTSIIKALNFLSWFKAELCSAPVWHFDRIKKRRKTDGDKITIASHDILLKLFLYTLSDSWSARWFSYLWPRMACHQTGELQGLSFSDGVDSFCVPLLFNITGMSWVYNADGRGCCGRKKKKSCISNQVISERKSSWAVEVYLFIKVLSCFKRGSSNTLCSHSAPSSGHK